MTDQAPEWFEAHLRKTGQWETPRKKPVDWPKLVLFVIALASAGFAATSYLFVSDARFQEERLENMEAHSEIVSKLQLFANTLESVQAKQMTQDKVIDQLHPRRTNGIVD